MAATSSPAGTATAAAEDSGLARERWKAARVRMEKEEAEWEAKWEDRWSEGVPREALAPLQAQRMVAVRRVAVARDGRKVAGTGYNARRGGF